MDSDLLAKLRKSCFRNRQRFENSKIAWCFNCQTEVDKFEFMIHGCYSSEKTGKPCEHNPKFIHLGDNDGHTALCPWCLSETIISDEDLENYGISIEKPPVSIMQSLHDRYVIETVTESNTFGPITSYEVLNE